MKKVFATISLIFAIAWYSLGALLLIFYFVKAYTSEAGLTFQRISDEWLTASNGIILIILLLPGFGAFMLWEMLRDRSD